MFIFPAPIPSPAAQDGSWKSGFPGTGPLWADATVCVCCCFRGLEPGLCWNMSMSPIFGCLGALRENQKQQAKQGETTTSCWCERQAPAEFLVQHEVYTITRLMQVWLHGSSPRLQSEGGEVALSQAMEEASRLNNRPVPSWAWICMETVWRIKRLQCLRNPQKIHWPKIMHFTVVADLGEMSCLAAITSLSGIKICSAITLEISKTLHDFFHDFFVS